MFSKSNENIFDKYKPKLNGVSEMIRFNEYKISRDMLDEDGLLTEKAKYEMLVFYLNDSDDNVLAEMGAADVLEMVLIRLNDYYEAGTGWGSNKGTNLEGGDVCVERVPQGEGGIGDGDEGELYFGGEWKVYLYGLCVPNEFDKCLRMFEQDLETLTEDRDDAIMEEYYNNKTGRVIDNRHM